MVRQQQWGSEESAKHYHEYMDKDRRLSQYEANVRLINDLSKPRELIPQRAGDLPPLGKNYRSRNTST